MFPKSVGWILGAFFSHHSKNYVNWSKNLGRVVADSRAWSLLLSLFLHWQCGVCKGQLGDAASGTDVRIRNGLLNCNDCYIRSRSKYPVLGTLTILWTWFNWQVCPDLTLRHSFAIGRGIFPCHFNYFLVSEKISKPIKFCPEDLCSALLDLKAVSVHKHKLYHAHILHDPEA